MSALAEPLEHATHDNRLARRNATVLAVAQALAGGNNTVIVATTSILGAMLAPQKGLATLPITFMVFGMWLGTLPVGEIRPLSRSEVESLKRAVGLLSAAEWEGSRERRPSFPRHNRKKHQGRFGSRP